MQIPFGLGAGMLKPRATVERLPSYRPPLRGRKGLRLDFNENTVGCSPRVLARLKTLTAEDLARYPERETVERSVAGHLGVDGSELLLTNGVDEGIHLLCETFLEPGDEVVVIVPTFAMYEISAAATGAGVIRLSADEQFRFPLAKVKAAINARTRLVAIANPNNPTGTVVAREQIAEVCRAAPDAAVLIDEAYFDFYGQTELGRWREHPNLFVARTFSKAYGMAGLRVGVLAGRAETMRAIRKVSSPYNVNSIALACLPDALADQEYVRAYVVDVRASRERLQQKLSEWGIRYWESQANFVLLSLGDLSQPFLNAMRQRGILVRDRSSDPGCQGCVRITVGTAKQTDRLLRTLRESFEQIGLKQPEAV